MKERFAERLRRTVSVRILLVAMACIAVPVAIWAQWTTSSNDIYNSNSGYVGIGTTSPARKLDIVGGGVRLDDRGDSCCASLEMVDSGQQTHLYSYGTGYGSGRFGIHKYGSGSAGGEVFTILPSGNLGIGTTSPDRAFVVAGAAAADVDSKSQAQIVSTAAYNASPVAGLSFGTKYNASGTLAWGVSIQGFKENSTDGNFGQALRFTTQAHNSSPSTKMTIDSGGNVGIGTTSPSSKLDVNGDVTISGNISAKYQDIAEWVLTNQSLTAGTVVVLSPGQGNSVFRSTSAYDTRVAGVISSTPGIVLGEAGEGKVKVATTGRVKVHADASQAPIEVGDLLVTSRREGVAMRSEPLDLGGVKIHRPGTLIGKALEPLSEGEGEILVLLSLQ